MDTPVISQGLIGFCRSLDPCKYTRHPRGKPITVRLKLFFNQIYRQTLKYRYEQPNRHTSLGWYLASFCRWFRYLHAKTVALTTTSKTLDADLCQHDQSIL